MNKTGLIFIESPLQLVNAVEYLDQQSIPFDQVTFLIYRDYGRKGNNYEQLISVLELYGISNYEVFKIHSTSSSFSKLYTSVKHFVSLMPFKNLDLVVLGDFRSSYFQFFCLGLRPKSVVLVDDGNASLNPFKVNNVVNKTFFKRYVESHHLTYFTIYSEFIDSQNILHNKYAYAKQKFASQVELNFDYIVGTTLVELDLVNECDYFDALKKVIEDRNKTIYLPHRYESQEKLNKIERQLGCKIEFKNLPLEIEFLTGGVFPKAFLGTISSFFDNLYFLNQQIEVRIGVIPETNIKDKATISRTNKSYGLYKKLGYKLMGQ